MERKGNTTKDVSTNIFHLMNHVLDKIIAMNVRVNTN